MAQKAKTAGELMAECKVPEASSATAPVDLMRFASCAGFMSGWMQAISPGITTTTSNGKVRLTTVELADGVTVGQTKRVFLLYIEKHPERENQAAAGPLFAAMKEAGLLKLKEGPEIGEEVPVAK